MRHKLDCTEKAYEIMMKHTHWRKPKRMTPKRQKAIDASFSLLTVTASEPILATDINVKVLDELQKLNRYFKIQNVSERIQFIQSRIKGVSEDLENSEQRLKIFREQNRQVSSPALQLEQERLSRDVDIQKGIFLTLKQQLELANIEKIQNETIDPIDPE